MGEQDYKTNTLPLTILQKKAIRINTFSDYRAHTSLLFKELNLLKCVDIVNLYTAIFMLQYSQDYLPPDFDGLFTSINSKHLHKTRLASTFNYSLPLVRTNYGRFNITFSGPKIWNSLDESLKILSKYSFKKKFKEQLITDWFVLVKICILFYSKNSNLFATKVVLKFSLVLAYNTVLLSVVNCLCVTSLLSV